MKKRNIFMMICMVQVIHLNAAEKDHATFLKDDPCAGLAKKLVFCARMECENYYRAPLYDESHIGHCEGKIIKKGFSFDGDCQKAFSKLRACRNEQTMYDRDKDDFAILECEWRMANYMDRCEGESTEYCSSEELSIEGCISDARRRFDKDHEQRLSQCLTTLQRQLSRQCYNNKD